MSRFHDAPANRLSPIILGTSPTHAERARTIIAHYHEGTLCTLMPDGDELGLEGYPYGSVAAYALDAAGNPLLLTSAMAEHTRNFAADARASLLVHEAAGPGVHNPLALGRATLLGRVEAVGDSELASARDLYLARHPEAVHYIDYGDFRLYRLRVQAIRYIGGFGRMSWVAAHDYAQATPDPIAPLARGITAHMNTDHADSLTLLCTYLAGLEQVDEATLKAVDRYGLELSARTPAGPRFVRLGFAAPAHSAEEVRAAVIDLVREARRLEQQAATATTEPGGPAQ